MIYKKILLFAIAFVYMLSGFVLANDIFVSPESVRIIDSSSQIEYFWLTTSSTESNRLISKLHHYKDSLLEPEIFYTFETTISAYDIKIDNNICSITYTTAVDGIELVLSTDKGQTFFSPIPISNNGINPALAVTEELITIVWEEDGKLSYKSSDNNGLSFTKKENHIITGESISNPKLLVDEENNIYLCFLADDRNSGLKRFMFTAWPTFEPYTVFLSADDLVNVGLKAAKTGLIAFGQKEYFGRRQTYLSVSLDKGLSFGKEKDLGFEKELIDLVWTNDGLATVTKLLPEDLFLHFNNKTGLLIEKIDLAALAPPIILFPQTGVVINSASLEVLYDAYLSQPFVFQPEISSGEAFDPIIVGGLTEELEDGDYYLRAIIHDGISQSPYSDVVEFTIDNTGPTISSIETDILSKVAIIKGYIDDQEANLTINGQAVTFEGSVFIGSVSVEVGNNYLALVATDEAGNTTVLTHEVFFNPEVPEILVLEPGESDWFKPDSVIVIWAKVFDLQSDIDEETEAMVYINDMLLEETLVFDPEDSTLYGFVTLPSNLIDGKHIAKIILSDKSGNDGHVIFSLNIDGAPPQIVELTNDAYFSSSQDTIALSVADLGAGIDPLGVNVKFYGISVEGSCTIEANTLILSSNTLIPEGSYEVEINLRDKVGNLSKTLAFSLVIDTTPPQIVIETSPEAKTSMNTLLIQANIIENYPQKVEIYINKEVVDSFEFSGTRLAKQVKLVPGNNEIELAVYDKAGNVSSACFSTFADITVQNYGALIENCVHGPNPFSPHQRLPGAFSAHGSGMVFSYALAKPSDVKILIYDITGTIIWRYESTNQPAGSAAAAWSGVNIFGQTVSNGIYPYVFSASSGGLREAKKGKIIVLH